MEVHGHKERGISIFLYAAPDHDRRFDRQMSERRVRISLYSLVIGGELLS